MNRAADAGPSDVAGDRRRDSGDAPGNVTVVHRKDLWYQLDMIRELPEESFDVGVIDGEQRNACAAAAAERVRPDGLIICY